MSLPERLYRIAKHKIGELKDQFDQMGEDAELDPEVAEKRRKAQSRKEARRELDDSLTEGVDNAPVTSNRPSAGTAAPAVRRTPEQIARGASAGQSSVQADPLEAHYRLLGVETGADLPTVQAAYQQKLARLDSLATPAAGSEEAQQAQALRERLHTAFQALKEALDPTARRFDLLEI